MNEEKQVSAPVMEQSVAEENPLPGDDELRAKWTELAAMYSSQPRLATALSKSGLNMREEDGRKIVEFSVMNDAQKKWIEERVLRDLEARFCKLTGCNRLRLEPYVIPDEEKEEVKYMPSEKAEDLMSRNNDVKELVIDLALDIK